MVVALHGEQDVSTLPTVVEALAGVGAVGDGDVVVDLSGVLFMDAAIVSALVAGRENLRTQSRILTLREPSSFAHWILGLCDLLELIEPISAGAAGSTGSCLRVHGPWSRTGPRRRAVKASPMPIQSRSVPAPPSPATVTARAV